MKTRMLTTPVKPEFYHKVRIAAAEKNLTLAGFVRQVLEAAVEKSQQNEAAK